MTGPFAALKDGRQHPSLRFGRSAALQKTAPFAVLRAFRCAPGKKTGD